MNAPARTSHIPAVPDIRTAPTVPEMRASQVPPSEIAPEIPGVTLVSLLRTGQHFEIWDARLGESQREVIVKIARRASREIALRSASEVRALAALTHRSIVRMFDHGSLPDGRVFEVLEKLRGTSLADLVRARNAGMPPSDAVRLLLPIASALTLAHNRGFVHNEVRAEHVLVVTHPDGSVVPVLIDFGGSARAVSAQDDRTGVLSLRRPALDASVDVRGLAATVFHAFSGRPPFTAPALDGARPPPPPAGAPVPRTGLSDRDLVLWRVLASALAPTNAGPTTTMHQFARALAEWAGLRGIDVDVTGSAIFYRWLGIAAPKRRTGT